MDAPGIDPLAAHPDLKADVENMAISRDRALEIARLRKGQATVGGHHKGHQEQQQFVRTIAAGRGRRWMPRSRARQPARARNKVAHITAYFKDPAKLQAFVTTYQPGQWKAAVLMMYDTFVPPAARHQCRPRSRCARATWPPGRVCQRPARDSSGGRDLGLGSGWPVGGAQSLSGAADTTRGQYCHPQLSGT